MGRIEAPGFGRSRALQGVVLPGLSTPRRGHGPLRMIGFMTAGFLLLTVLVHVFGAPLALAGLLVLPAVAFLLIRPEAATVITVLLLYVNFPAILTSRHGVPAAAAGAFIGILLIPMLHALFVRGERLRTDATFGLMMMFMLVMVASSMVAIDRGVAFERIASYAVEGLILYWLVINAVRTRGALRRVVWTLVGAGAFLGLLSLYQQITGAYEQEFGGLAYRNFVPAEAAGDLGESRRRTWDRAQGPVNEPNRFAQILIVLLPFAVYLVRRHSGRAGRHWAVVAGLLVLGGVILTLSRGAFVALMVLGAVMLALRWLRTSRLIVALVVLTVIVPLVSPFYSSRLQSMVGVTSLFTDDTGQQQEVDGAIRGRTTVMLAALNVFLDHPILGVGPGQFSPFYVQDYTAELDVRYREIRTPRRAHTLYLETAAESGVLGLGIFLAIVFGLLHALWRERLHWLRTRPELADIATAAALSVLAYCVTAVFLHLSYQRYFWLLIAVSGATLHVLRKERRMTVEEEFPGPRNVPSGGA